MIELMIRSKTHSVMMSPRVKGLPYRSKSFQRLNDERESTPMRKRERLRKMLDMNRDQAVKLKRKVDEIQNETLHETSKEKVSQSTFKKIREKLKGALNK